MNNEELLEGLKKVELNILKEFIKICEENNIRYFICAGTLLGAVRHNGFIPWDDDIDILMFREDYEKFISVASSYLPDYYFLQNIYTDKRFYFNYTKIRDSRTTFIETTVKDLDINHGVFIDIFPLDMYPESFFKQLYIKIINKFSNSIIGECFYDFTLNRNKEKIINRLSHLFFKNPKSAAFFKERTLKKLNSRKEKKVKNYSGAWGDKEIYDIHLFDESILIKFEGIEVKAPKRYDAYLKCMYGNYMILPPIDDRVSHHGCEIIDLNKSYKCYGYK